MPIHSDAANKGLRGYSFLHLPPSSVVTKAKPRFFIPHLFLCKSCLVYSCFIKWCGKGANNCKIIWLWHLLIPSSKYLSSKYYFHFRFLSWGAKINCTTRICKNSVSWKVSKKIWMEEVYNLSLSRLNTAHSLYVCPCAEYVALCKIILVFSSHPWK